MGRDYEEVKETLANNVRRARYRADLSQDELAIKAGIDRTYISQIERAIRNPSLQVLCKLANVLDTDPAILISNPPTEGI